MKYALRRVLPVLALFLSVPFACSTGDGALDPNPTGGSNAGGTTGTSIVAGGTNGETGGTASGGTASGGIGAGGSATAGTASGGSAVGGSATGGKPGAGGSTSGGSTGTTPCSSATCKGVCVAQDQNGCGGVWKCVNDPGVCTTDIAQFCGCDGKTFSSSSSCVANAWSHRGSCEQGVDCDPGKIMCRAATPNCPVGYVPSVVGTCYGPCVRLQECTCKTSDQCPAKPSACSGVTNRCVAPVF
jgi:hypothetical protein